jgi:Cupin domain
MRREAGRHTLPCQGACSTPSRSPAPDPDLLCQPPRRTDDSSRANHEQPSEGTLDVYVDGEWSQVRAGERVTVPANVEHTLRNATDAPVKMRVLAGIGTMLGFRLEP